MEECQVSDGMPALGIIAVRSEDSQVWCSAEGWTLFLPLLHLHLLHLSLLLPRQWDPQ